MEAASILSSQALSLLQIVWISPIIPPIEKLLPFTIANSITYYGNLDTPWKIYWVSMGDSPAANYLTVDSLHQLATAAITKSVCLRVVSSQYDPLGIAAWLVVILNVELKELYKLRINGISH